jgi:hypothetical protein
VCYYDDYTCRYWSDPEKEELYQKEKCYSALTGSYIPEMWLPLTYNKVSYSDASDLTENSDNDDDRSGDGEESTADRTDIPIYGVAAAAYVTFATWWPLIMAWIAIQIKQTSTTIELFDKAVVWSLLGPFAGNFCVFAYHAFRIEELERGFRVQQLIFPAIWFAWTGLSMVFQLFLYPSVAWWIVLRWGEAVDQEELGGDVMDEDVHSIEPILDDLPEP